MSSRKMRLLLIRLSLVLLMCLVLGGCEIGKEWNNSIEFDTGKILLYEMGGKEGGRGWIDFISLYGDRAHLEFSGIRELDRFYVNYLDENGEIKDDKLLELKKRMEKLK